MVLGAVHIRKKLIINNNMILLFVVVFWATSNIVAISQSNYSVQGVFRGHGAQGMAIHKDYAFLLNDSGLCRLYDLKHRKVLLDFPLASASSTNHANSASFGSKYINGNSNFPVLYISECRKPYRCFVENINFGNSELIQIIQFEIDRKLQVVHDWIVDKENEKIYAISRISLRSGQSSDTVRIVRFSLPPIDRFDIILDKNDVEKEFCIVLPNMLQGGVIKSNILYLPVGLDGNGKTQLNERAIVLVDLENERQIEKMMLNDLIENEPEDVDFFENKLLLFCGQEGGIYEIELEY